ncbi:uncharacterized protein LOC133196657 [Saccostrea echinata]|uniref:uncharacterized protein LOC133196657 n=1 Tax=Saccostrea echinata TaxID=191078 RepID=UPI002A81E2B5|nr:uncharacterized protein LOC133196657 [Saccostrea echinata]
MSLKPLLLLAVTLVATNAQQQPDPKVIEMLEQRNWKKYTQEVGLEAFKWTASVSGQLYNESAWLSERNNIVAMKSRDRDIRKKGYEIVDFMTDLATGEVAIRIRVPTSITALPASMVDPQMTRREKRQKLRDLVKDRDRMCFIHSDPRLTLAAVKAELQKRSTGGSVQMGIPQHFTVKEKNRILTQNLKSPLITSFCTRSAEHNNNFRLEKGAPVATPTSTYQEVKFMGQIDTAQARASVPYTLHIEQQIMNGVTSEPV